jgi:hypothetical protein
MMITRELLSEVLGFEIENLWVDGCLIVWKEDGMSEINIHELAHKCKEWAFWDDYYVITKFRMPDIYREEKKIDCGFELYQQDNLVKQSWWIDTEPEAIFQTCQWILDNRRKKRKELTR